MFFESLLGFLNDALTGVKIRNENQKHAKGVRWIKSVVYHSFKTILQQTVISELSSKLSWKDLLDLFISSLFFSNKEVALEGMQYLPLQWNVFTSTFNRFFWDKKTMQKLKDACDVNCFI